MKKPHKASQIMHPVQMHLGKLVAARDLISEIVEAPGLLLNDPTSAMVARFALLKSICDLTKASAAESERIKKVLRQVYIEQPAPRGLLSCPGFNLAFDAKAKPGYTVLPHEEWHVRLEAVATPPE